MNKFEEARTAMLERMSVPEHITVNGRATLVPEERRVFRTTVSILLIVMSNINMKT